MYSGLLTIVALIGVGFAFGVLRKQASPGKNSFTVRLVLIVASIPFVGFWFAGVVHSDTPGWIFGLSLMFGIPILLLFALGWIVGALYRQHREPRPSTQSTTAPVTAPAPTNFGATLLVRIDRDSVHAGDDGSSHALGVMVGNGTSLAGLVEQILGMGFLPSINGGQATWVIESTGQTSGPVGVFAQQWTTAVFTIRSSILVSEHFADRAGELYFRYRCQENPDQVLAQLGAN